MNLILKELFTNIKFIVWLFILVFLLIYAFIYPQSFSVNPARWFQVPRALPPSSDFPFGTTLLGQDVFKLTPLALSNTLLISFIAGAIGVLIALVLGFIASFASRIINTITSIFIDIMCMIPGAPILMIILYAWRDKLTMPMIGLIFGAIGWTFSARIYKGLFEGLKTRLYIATSQYSGLGLLHIMVKDVMPYVIRFLMVNFIDITIWAIGNEVTISVFGAMKMDEVTIGTTIHWALQYQALHLGIWWWIVFPVLVLIITVTSIYNVTITIDNIVFVRRTKI
uniref:ABC transporter permease n=1 Tax=Ignisphaera aggregans TaxID=334771 RepID=A0A7C5UT00_9CREN